jgi:hypothetical protein
MVCFAKKLNFQIWGALGSDASVYRKVLAGAGASVRTFINFF